MKRNFLFLYGAILSLISCNNAENPLAFQSDTHSRGKVEIYIEESFKPLFESCIYTFESQFPNADIKPIYCTEHEAIKSLHDKKTKTIFMTRDFTKEEKAKMLAAQVQVRSEKLAEDAVALVIHPTNNDSTISVNTLKAILKGQKINWDSKNEKIDIVFDNQNSANFFYLKNLIGDVSLSKNIFAVKSNEEVIKYVKNHPNALGVIGVNWISDEDDQEVLDFLKDIKVMSVSNGNSTNYFKPYQAYIYTKEYPLTRELWSINKGSLSGLNSGFVNFMTGEKGQLIIKKSALIPATAPIRMIQVKTE